MSYSPISTIRIKNFRNLGEVNLDFNDSPIITLIGENESGKTSVVKAIGVCALNANPREHKDYIRDGTQGFGVEITLQDGTKVTRLKTNSISRYTVQYPDGRLWEANKLDGAPKEVIDVMGMTEEPETKEFLHIRTYEDQLLFVVTPASTNYKVMYDALKVGQITSGIKTGSAEANNLKAKISKAESGIEALSRTMSAIKLYDITNLLNLRDRVKEKAASIEKMEKVIEAIEAIDRAKKSLGSLNLLDKAPEINVANTMNISSVGRIIDRIDEVSKAQSIYKEIDTAEKIDLTSINKIDRVIEIQHSLDIKIKKAGALVELTKVPEISELRVSNLSRLMDLIVSMETKQRLDKTYNKINDLQQINPTHTKIETYENRIKELDETNKKNQEDIVKIDDYVDQVLKWMKSVGVATATCPKCGESVVMDISSYT